MRIKSKNKKRILYIIYRFQLTKAQKACIHIGFQCFKGGKILPIIGKILPLFLYSMYTGR